MVRGLWALAPAPLLALLNNNQLESRLFFIYHRFPCESWRPEAEQVQGTGIWLPLLKAMARLHCECEHGAKEGHTGSEGEIEIRIRERWLRNGEMGAEFQGQR